jgi:hypothetical protein
MSPIPGIVAGQTIFSIDGRSMADIQHKQRFSMVAQLCPVPRG